MTASHRVFVLIVEDDALVRTWLEAALDETEFRVTGSASTAAEAVELATEHVPGLVLTDYRLPDRLGTELVQELRLRGIRAPVVVMTANPERGLNEVAREAGAQATILKDGRPGLLASLRAVGSGEQSFDARHPPRASEPS